MKVSTNFGIVKLNFFFLKNVSLAGLILCGFISNKYWSFTI